MGLRKAAKLAAVAGILLIVANVTSGSLLLELTDRIARDALPREVSAPVHQAIALLLFVAGLGGLAVLAGALMYREGWRKAGNFVVDLGAGTGLLGLLLLAAMSLLSGEARSLVGWLLGPAGLGVLLSILARREAGDSGIPKVPGAVRRRLRL